jgi:hypothetical protein
VFRSFGCLNGTPDRYVRLARVLINRGTVQSLVTFYFASSKAGFSLLVSISLFYALREKTQDDAKRHGVRMHKIISPSKVELFKKQSTRQVADLFEDAATGNIL